LRALTRFDVLGVVLVMKNNSLGKIVFFVMVVAAIAVILYPKLVSSNNNGSNDGSVNSAPPTSTQPVQDGNQGPSQSDIQTMIQSQKQGEGKGETQLAEAVKSGKPTMVLFHSDG
jgi:hypothetical protein